MRSRKICAQTLNSWLLVEVACEYNVKVVHTFVCRQQESVRLGKALGHSTQVFKFSGSGPCVEEK